MELTNDEIKAARVFLGRYKKLAGEHDYQSSPTAFGVALDSLIERFAHEVARARLDMGTNEEEPVAPKSKTSPKSSKAPKTTGTGLVIHVPQSTRLPDDDQWVNRFEIRSESSDRVYVVSQNRKHRHWGCNCPGWRTRRTCKHLANIGLPAGEKPFEAKIEGK